MSLRTRMQADNWQGAYITDLETHRAGLRAAGVSALLAQTLVRDDGDAYLLRHSVTGNPFGTLRGKNSAIAGYEAYIRQTFPDDASEIVRLVVRYATGVRESSWAKMVQLVKEFLVRQRTAPAHAGYFWKSAADMPKAWDQAITDIGFIRNEILDLPRGGANLAAHELNLRRAVVTWHAFTQELLRFTAFPGNNQVAKTVTVVRTESSAAMAHFRRVVGGAAPTPDEMDSPSLLHNVQLTCVRGALESSSLYTVKNIHGNIVTEMVVPHHRVFALYMTGQPLSNEHQLSFFENDTENEVTFMPEGIPFEIKPENQLAFAKPPAVANITNWYDM